MWVLGSWLPLRPEFTQSIYILFFILTLTKTYKAQGAPAVNKADQDTL